MHQSKIGTNVEYLYSCDMRIQILTCSISSLRTIMKEDMKKAFKIYLLWIVPNYLSCETNSNYSVFQSNYWKTRLCYFLKIWTNWLWSLHFKLLLASNIRNKHHVYLICNIDYYLIETLSFIKACNIWNPNVITPSSLCF